MLFLNTETKSRAVLCNITFTLIQRQQSMNKEAWFAQAHPPTAIHGLMQEDE